ncbi:hypothetical protein [Fimbriimonas ginsengisoli]|uniref:Uncharacterized protein n=1 Tax=Fimbriimonas ginsengisoli Gsoil 348 TaxID=661478 RepID=A0A068NMD0_FIMGI|nr:hypothetical protein [Fimbriimonas ginsengisoli]AIE83940.1 hypothetical protein OP10G_0572 [Fimbriimonas ginsengisoli Gsoil 348]
MLVSRLLAISSYILCLTVGSAQISGKNSQVFVKGQEQFPFGPLLLRTISVRSGQTSYLQKYDQREDRLTPGFKKDRLSVIELEAENPSSQPAPLTAMVPALSDGEGSLTDRPHWDVRQKSFVRTTSDVRQDPQDKIPYSFDPVMVAPGGRVRFALIFSLHVSSRPAHLTLRPGKTIVVSGNQIIMPTGGTTVDISLSATNG